MPELLSTECTDDTLWVGGWCDGISWERRMEGGGGLDVRFSGQRVGKLVILT